MEKTNFENCSLKEVDFTEADLEGSNFHESLLSGAVFERTNLVKSNFTTAQNFNINPEINNIKAAHFSKENLSGLLLNYQLNIK